MALQTTGCAFFSSQEFSWKKWQCLGLRFES
jgi:hypothetical protein